MADADCQTSRRGVSSSVVYASADFALQSSLLPVPHGFSLRGHGVSLAPYDSLNLGRSTADLPAHVEENYRRMAAPWEGFLEGLCTVSQVHGERVVEAPLVSAKEAPRTPFTEADGLWTDDPATWVGVFSADCIPLLLVDPKGRRVAAVHSGWKGTLAEIALRAVQALQKAGTQPGELLAAVGPSIRRCCYEVDAPLAHRFTSHFGLQVVGEEGGKPHLDLVEALRLSLVRAGLKPDRVDVLPACTACEPERFFSHRRDKGLTGRHLGFVSPRF